MLTVSSCSIPLSTVFQIILDWIKLITYLYQLLPDITLYRVLYNGHIDWISDLFFIYKFTLICLFVLPTGKNLAK